MIDMDRIDAIDTRTFKDKGPPPALSEYHWRVLERHDLSGGVFQPIAMFYSEVRARGFYQRECSEWPNSVFKLQRLGAEAWIDVEIGQ